jgi:hypothetical protein
VRITTRTAVIPLDAVQNAYNDAVMSGRMALAREIGQLWLSMLAERKVIRHEEYIRAAALHEKVAPGERNRAGAKAHLRSSHIDRTD